MKKNSIEYLVSSMKNAKPRTPMLNVQSNPKPQLKKFWDFGHRGLIGIWSLVIGFFRNTKYQTPDTRYYQRKSSGFSLIEMLVTTSIIAIVSSIVLFSFPSFASKIVLENLTHEIALVVRQAQVFGIGIKQAPGGGFPSYGVHFDIGTEETKKQVILFADTSPPGNPNGVFDNGVDLVVDPFTIQRGNSITALCYNEPCVHTNMIDITFTRPNPEAMICSVGGCGGISSAKITVSPPAGSDIAPLSITVYASGQIAVTAE